MAFERLPELSGYRPGGSSSLSEGACVESRSRQPSPAYGQLDDCSLDQAPRGRIMDRSGVCASGHGRAGTGGGGQGGGPTGGHCPQRLSLPGRPTGAAESAGGVGPAHAAREPSVRPTGEYERPCGQAGALRVAVGRGATGAATGALLAAKGEEHTRAGSIGGLLFQRPG